MKVQFPKFRQYIGDYMLRHRNAFWLEMALNVSTADKIPVSPSLAMLLTFTPNGRAGQGAALQFIQTQGLYEACTGRKHLAEKFKKILEREVYEHEIWSKTAWKETKQYDRSRKNTDLETLWGQHKDEYQDQYEPKTLPLGGNVGSKISIAKINEELVKHGFKPFYFGGPDGYVEWLEDNSDWAEPHVLTSHLRPAWNGDKGVRHQRHGADLSSPDYVELEQQPGKFRYVFNSYIPQQDKDHYGRTIDNLSKLSGPHIRAIAGGGADRPGMTDSYGDEFAKWLASHTEEANSSGGKVTNPFTPGSGVPLPYPEDPEMVELWKKIIEAGLKKYVVDMQTQDTKKPERWFNWKPEHYQEVLDKIFLCKRKPGGLIPNHFDQRWTNPVQKPKAHNTLNTSGLFSTGIDAEPELASKLQEITYNAKGIDHTKFVGTEKFKKREVDPLELEKQGFALSQGGKISDALQAGRNFMTIRHGYGANTRQTYRLEKDLTSNKWYIEEPDGIEDTSASQMSARSKVILPGIGDMHQVAKRLHAPVDPDIADKIQRKWQTDPSAYGDKEYKPKTGGYYIKSVWDAAEIGINMAVKRHLSRATPRKDILNALDGESGGAFGIAWEAMRDLMGSYKFTFGDVRKELKNLADDKRGTEKDTSTKAIIMRHANCSDQEADAWVEKFEGIVRQNRMPEQEDFPPEVYAALLENGMHWRKFQAAGVVSQKISDMLELSDKMKTGGGTTSGETGEVVAHDYSEDEARARIDKAISGTAVRKASNMLGAERTSVATGASRIASAIGTTEYTSKLSAFRKARQAQFGKQIDERDYDQGYQPAHKVAVEHLDSFRRLAQMTGDPTPKDDDEREAPEIMWNNHRRSIYEPLEQLKKMFSIGEKSPAQKAGTVDGICDAICNSVVNHFEEVSKVADIGYDKEGWKRYTIWLYQAFLGDDPRYDLDELPRS